MEINCPYCHAPQDIEIQAISNSYACGECGKTYKVLIAVTTDGAKPITNTMQQEPQPSALVYLISEALYHYDNDVFYTFDSKGEIQDVTHIVEKAVQIDAERIATSLHEIMAEVKEAANIGQIGSDKLERKIKDILYR
jgi:DNA-directed RNA polymerase subunit RPC12/RpoP